MNSSLAFSCRFAHPRRVLPVLLAAVLLAVSAAGQATGTEAQKLFPAAGADFQSFGRVIQVQGDVLLITANGADNKGAAYCYRRVSGVWTPSQKFTGSDSLQGDFFGFKAAMNGGLAVIGAQQADPKGFNSGAAYVFQDNGTAWSQIQKLVPADGDAGDAFGSAVAIAGDLIVVAAHSDEAAGNTSGSLYVYRRAGASWAFEQKLVGSTTDAGDQFGWDVDTDGVTIVTSAVTDEEPGLGETGAVFAFQKVGATWQEVQRIVPDDAAGGDTFGWVLALDADGLVVGSPSHDLAPANGGAVYAYRHDGAAWALEQEFAPDKLGFDAAFGWSIALQGDRLVAGAPSSGNAYSGALYQFHHDGDHWVQVHEWLTSDEAVQAFPPPQLGMSCALDGKTAFGGAPFGDGAVVNAGAAYRFEGTDLGLQATAVPGQLDLETWGGLASAPMVVVLQSLGGVPFSLVIFADSFDAQGYEQLSLNVPPAASGLQAKFLTGGYWHTGFKGLSNLASVTFP